MSSHPFDTGRVWPSRLVLDVDSMPEQRLVSFGDSGLVNGRRFQWGPIAGYHRAPETMLDSDNDYVILRVAYPEYLDGLPALILIMSTKDTSLADIVARELAHIAELGLVATTVPVPASSSLRTVYRVGPANAPDSLTGYVLLGDHDGQPFMVNVIHDPRIGFADADLFLEELRWISTGEGLGWKR